MSGRGGIILNPGDIGQNRDRVEFRVYGIRSDGRSSIVATMVGVLISFDFNGSLPVLY